MDIHSVSVMRDLLSGSSRPCKKDLLVAAKIIASSVAATSVGVLVFDIPPPFQTGFNYMHAFVGIAWVGKVIQYNSSLKSQEQRETILLMEKDVIGEDRKEGFTAKRKAWLQEARKKRQEEGLPPSSPENRLAEEEKEKARKDRLRSKFTEQWELCKSRETPS